MPFWQASWTRPPPPERTSQSLPRALICEPLGIPSSVNLDCVLKLLRHFVFSGKGHFAWWRSIECESVTEGCARGYWGWPWLCTWDAPPTKSCQSTRDIAAEKHQQWLVCPGSCRKPANLSEPWYLNLVVSARLSSYLVKLEVLIYVVILLIIELFRCLSVLFTWFCNFCIKSTCILCV